MDQKREREWIEKGRSFLKSRAAQEEELDYQSDQEKKLPQPPLVKANMREAQIDLPRGFQELARKDDFLTVVMKRKSSRVYTQESMSLLQLS